MRPGVVQCLATQVPTVASREMTINHARGTSGLRGVLVYHVVSHNRKVHVRLPRNTGRPARQRTRQRTRRRRHRVRGEE